MSKLDVQVAIIGAGPAGLCLGWLLARAGISFAIVERQSQVYVENRIRAGILEHASVKTLIDAGAGERLQANGLTHRGAELAFGDARLRIDFEALTGHCVTVYGQTEITRDLNRLHHDSGSSIIYECDDVSLADIAPSSPSKRAIVRAQQQNRQLEIACDYVAGCDGYHGVSRASIPLAIQQNYQRNLPIGWLGLLSDTPPIADELIYANHQRGFALCSMRSTTRSRYYIQVDADADPNAWSDDRFWAELTTRLPSEVANTLITGPSIEKSVAPLRSFVTEPMHYGRLFLAGDAAHIVPPTGAKGLNLAIADVNELAAGLIEFYASGRNQRLNGYSAERLRHVWRAQRFSWWFTQLTHRLDDDRFRQQLQLAEFENLVDSTAGQAALAENYVGTR